MRYLVLILIVILSAGLAFAQSLGDKLGALVPPGGDLFLWFIGALVSAGLLGLLANTIAGVVATIPFIGPPAALGIKIFFGIYQTWLTEQLPLLAEQAWQAAEAKANQPGELLPASGPQKKEQALTTLKQQAPDSRLADLEAALEAAHTRNKAAGLELSR